MSRGESFATMIARCRGGHCSKGIYVRVISSVLSMLLFCRCAIFKMFVPGESIARALKEPPAAGHICSGKASIPLRPEVVIDTESSPLSDVVHVPVKRRQRYRTVSKTYEIYVCNVPDEQFLHPRCL
jgi:hypothetical protein